MFHSLQPSAISSQATQKYTNFLAHFNENLTDASYLDHAYIDGSTASETTIKVLGSGSRYWNGSAWLDYTIQGTEFDFPAEFTLETYVRFTGLTGWQDFISRTYFNDEQQGYGITKSGVNNKVQLTYAVNGAVTTIVESTTVMTINTWYHVAVTRDSSNTVRLFINGILEDTELSYTTLLNGEDVLGIGAIPDGSHGTRFQHLSKLSGYLDEVRISKGVCRYTSDFTPTITEFILD